MFLFKEKNDNDNDIMIIVMIITFIILLSNIIQQRCTIHAFLCFLQEAICMQFLKRKCKVFENGIQRGFTVTA